ncbi:hypothetical protein [Nocardiopsis sp. HUAS JQ3]|nr:hypothetical protein [Nocardiopsis sp. HUAS JQ3]WDZ89294.1 hypothetical protein PV789_20410 [Nocardiopsis sp. HUAS JQ3]
MRDGLGTGHRGDAEPRRRRAVGAALHHGADIGRWRAHAAPLPPSA